MSIPKVLEICLTLLKLCSTTTVSLILQMGPLGMKSMKCKHSKTTTITKKKKKKAPHCLNLRPTTSFFFCHAINLHVEFHMSMTAYITCAKTIILVTYPLMKIWVPSCMKTKRYYIDPHTSPPPKCFFESFSQPLLIFFPCKLKDIICTFNFDFSQPFVMNIEKRLTT